MKLSDYQPEIDYQFTPNSIRVVMPFAIILQVTAQITAQVHRKYYEKLLTVYRLYYKIAHNTPTKPMLFSNSMLKLSGLFFAYNVLTTSSLLVTTPSINEQLRWLYDRV